MSVHDKNHKRILLHVTLQSSIDNRKEPLLLRTAYMLCLHMYDMYITLYVAIRHTISLVSLQHYVPVNNQPCLGIQSTYHIIPMYRVSEGDTYVFLCLCTRHSALFL